MTNLILECVPEYFNRSRSTGKTISELIIADLESWNEYNRYHANRKETTQPHPHCEHECVCWLYPDNFTGACDADACGADTRTHTSPPAPAFTPHIPGKENSNTYRCCEVCPNVLSKPVFRCNCLQPEHDAQVAKAERERMLNRLQAVVALEKAEQYPWFRNCYDYKTIEPIKEWGSALARIEKEIESLRQEREQ